MIKNAIPWGNFPYTASRDSRYGSGWRGPKVGRVAKLAKTSGGPSTSRVDIALARIREAIEERRLLPGEALRLDALSQELEMSVQPVREAIRLLEAEGVVERSANRGVVVAKVSLAQIIELSCLRTVLEPMITSLATLRASDDEIAELRATHQSILDLLESGDGWESVIPRTIEWHEHLYRLARSPQLSEFVARVWVAIRINSAWRNSHASDSMHEHDQILQAMEQRNPHAASRAMREHVREAVIGHLEGFVGSGDPSVTAAISAYDQLLSQMDIPALPAR